MLDSVYRLWLSVRVVRRHWNDSLVEVPPCDARIEAEDLAIANESVQRLGDNDKKHLNKTHSNSPSAVGLFNCLFTEKRGPISSNKNNKPSVFGAIITLLTNFWMHALLVGAFSVLILYSLAGIDILP